MTPTPGRLVDSFGRVHNNLRISVTDRCNIRCVYCMPEKVEFMPRDQLLRFEEIARFVEIVAPLGVDKIRLTGGEPLLRKDLDVLVRMLAAIPGIADVGLTTNGMLLAPAAAKLRDAGLERINISLDTLDPARFERLARRRGLDDAIEGVFAAKRAGFAPIKLNAVIIRGFNEQDVAPLARFAREHALEMRFIEYMPLDAGHLWEREKVFFAHEILDVLAREVGPLAPAADGDPRAPAMDYDYLDGGGRVGLIASVSRPFCGSCNRLRLTADGKLRNCLFALEETDVKELLRGEGPAEEVARAVAASVSAKWEGHEINTARFIQPDRPMHSIGG
ncbi:GTP 3',8-cyclase MoaA [Planctomyces sp. SH-PL62]|uniref:GTP 3',8-cyclase MoaA n=1 Tax=Planctomyces sp. SH-PL62 TaxID=1636152 RepID=UPI00078E1F66|nr:GTP 3',8-cyclase MoaA [Planctomyces sp. SH-PL62]AMV39542.1 Cyclic pyranopterin monophosphate synthase [Planctomyces sp. SH-PL62]